jgi:hypothetical protein
MEKSRLAILIESVMDGTVGIEQVWQSYGNLIRGTESTSSEEEAFALTGLYLRYGAYLEKNGYLSDARTYYEDGYNILNREKSHMAENHFNDATETFFCSLARINNQLDDNKQAFGYIKKLKQMFPRKEEYRLAYINSISTMISKFTTAVIIVVSIIFLVKLAEIYLFDSNFLPTWLVNIGWALWIVMLIIQFTLPWAMKKFMK